MTRRAALSSLILIAAGCASAGERESAATSAPSAVVATVPGPTPQDAAASKPKDAARKKAQLHRDLETARLKVERARRDAAYQEIDDAAAVAKAGLEAEFARRKAATFDEREAPSRAARARLDADAARDGHDDSKEELAQLELMYKGHEIGDMTKDLVLARAKRSLERSRRRVELAALDLQTLEERTLPHERDRLLAEASDRERDVEKARRNAERSAFERRLAVAAAESEVRRLEEEIADLESAP
ncbi:MAG TPA: hypothetical protein VEI02_15610 [Planctomycetota bacterium]|nr:hypothetical protein [Planctomycetota bacterium]